MKKLLIAASMLALSSVAAQAAFICNDKASYVNVRYGPSALQYGIYDKIDNGWDVRVLGSTYNDAGYRWVKIRYYGYLGVMDGWVDGDNVCGNR